MRREIYQVNAMLVGSDNSFYVLDGYPKSFDSRSYSNDIDKTYRRAMGEYNNVLSTMYTRDDRPLQVANVIEVSHGTVIASTFIGEMPEVPDPEPEPVEE